MKVLLINVFCGGGSAGGIVYDIYSYLNDGGNIATICYARGAQRQEKNIFKFAYDWETYLHAFLTRITGFTGCFSYFSTKRLLNYIEIYKPDIVHIHSLYTYFINIGTVLSYLKKNKIKTVLTLHSEFDYTGKCGYSYECTKWKTECGNCPHLQDYPKSLFFDFTKQMFRRKKELFKGFDNLTVITPSQWLADRTRQSFLGCYPIYVIHNGVDTTVFYPRNADALRKKHNIKPDEKVILAVAPNIMSERKGGKYVLKVAELLKNENIRFILVGVDGVTEEIRDNVILKGRTSNREELAQYYSLADAFVICSSKETFSMTCAEAVCCGTSIIGFKCGAPETVFAEDFGKFVKYGDIDTLAKAIRTVNIKTPEFVESFANSAKENFAKNKFAEAHLRLYQKLTEQKQ